MKKIVSATLAAIAAGSLAFTIARVVAFESDRSAQAFAPPAQPKPKPKAGPPAPYVPNPNPPPRCTNRGC